MVSAITGIARLRILDGSPDHAAELLGFAGAHLPDEAWVTKLRVEPLRGELAGRLTTDEMEAALVRGAARTMDDVITELFSEA